MPRSDKPRQIFKYKLFSGGGVPMPEGAEILSVQMQHGTPVLWALVDPEAPAEVRRIEVIGTGQESTDLGKEDHIATLQLEGGGLVLHIFERREAGR